PPPAGEFRQPNEPIHTAARTEVALKASIRHYREGKGWPELPVPPPAWVKVKGRPRPGQGSPEEFERDDVKEPNKMWVDPPTHWYSQYATKVLKRVPYEEILAGEAKEPLLAFIACVLDWTNAKNAPPWVKKGRRDRESSRLFEWNHALASTLGSL